MNTLLNFLISSGMLCLSDTDMVIFMTERKKYLTEHPYKIYQGKDNCWHTYLPDDTKATGRRHVKRRTQAEVEEAVIFYWKDRDDNPTTSTNGTDDSSGCLIEFASKTTPLMKPSYILKGESLCLKDYEVTLE